MKNGIKRFISLALVFVMLVGVFGVCSFAEEKESKYEKYAVLGDSNASGYGLAKYFENAGSTEAVKEGDLIPGSYPAIIADALGIKDVAVCSHSGWRTDEFLNAINPGKYPNRDEFFRHALWFVDDASLEGADTAIQEAVKTADFITVNFGSNDIYSYAFNSTYGVTSKLLGMLPNPALLASDPAEYFSKLIHMAEMAGVLKEVVDTLTGFLDQYTESYLNNMPKVIDEIKALNGEKNAKIMVLGIFCPVSFDLRIDHQVVVDFKSSADKRVTAINDKLKALCEEKGCTFVDVAKAECYGLPALDVGKLITGDPDLKYSAVKMAHPNEAGHEYIAKQILSALNTSLNAPFVTASYTKLFKNTILKWTKTKGAISYRIYRATSPDGQFKCVGTSFNNMFIDIVGAKGTTYYYKVCAVKAFSGGNTSPMSTVIEVVAK